MSAHAEVMDLVAQMKSAEQPFVLATVVRTVSVTAAKAGAKANALGNERGCPVNSILSLDGRHERVSSHERW
jgi:hypothetical protein